MLPAQATPGLNDSVNLANKTSYFNLPNFELRIVRTPPQIVIQAENWETSKVYSVILNAQAIEKLKSFIFDSVASLHSSLIGGLEGTHKDTKVEIDDAAMIKLIWEGQVGPTRKKHIVEIQLKEQEPNPIEDLERYLAKLEENKCQSDNYREQHLIKMFESVATFMRNQAQPAVPVMPVVPIIKQEQVNVDLSAIYSSIEKLSERIDKMEQTNQKLASELTDKITRLEQNQKNLVSMDEFGKGMKKFEEKVVKLEETKKKVDEANLGNVGRILGDLGGRINKLEASALEMKNIHKKVDEMKGMMEVTEQSMNSMIMNQAEMFNRVLSDIGERVSEVQGKYASLNRKVEQNMSEEGGRQSQETEKCLDKIKKIEEEMSSRFMAYNSRVGVLENDCEEISKTVNTLKSGSADFLTITTTHSDELGRIADRTDDLKKDLVEMIESVDRKAKTAMDVPTIFQKMQTQFKPEHPQDLTYEDSNKAIKSNPGRAVSQAIFCENPLPKTGKHCFSWKMEGVDLKGDMGVLAFGIGPRILKETGNILEEGSYFFNPFDKLAYLSGNMMAGHDAKPMIPEDVIHVMVDRDNKAIYFKINDQLCYDAALDEESFYGAEVYPCVWSKDCSDLKLSLV